MLRRYVYIFHEAALGDFLMTWPLVLGIARVWPQMRVVVATASGKGELASDVLRVEHEDAEVWAGLHRKTPKLAEKQARRLAMMRCVFTFVAEPCDTWSANVAALGGEVDVHHLKGRPAGDIDGSIADWILDQVADPAVREAGRSVLSHIRTRGLGTFDPAGPVLAHVGSGSKRKNWPAKHFAELGEGVSDLKLIGGEAEASGEMLPNVQILGDLRALRDRLAGARAFVGHDTGPTHLAAMLGLPTVALHADPARTAWHPVGPRVRVLPLAASSQDVAEALGEVTGACKV